MAVFLGPRQTIAEVRDGRRRAREMAWREPILGVVGGTVGRVGGWPFVFNVGAMSPPASFSSSPFGGVGVGKGARCCELCTSHGSQPPGAWVIFALSRPRKRGMEGPVRSMSRMPTDFPARERERASWVVMEDLPTPPLPERTFESRELCDSGWI